MTYHKKADYYTKLAKAKSYPARSVFKLDEINKRLHIFKKGSSVLDLGSSPGSWMKYASQQVGQNGIVIGVDIKPLKITQPSNAIFILEDVYSITPAKIIDVSGVNYFDVILSDLAPRTTGIKNTDQEKSWELFLKAFEIVQTLLKNRGHFVGKLFFSQWQKKGVDLLKQNFREVRTIKPQITRKGSTEIFIIGKNFIKNKTQIHEIIENRFV